MYYWSYKEHIREVNYRLLVFLRNSSTTEVVRIYIQCCQHLIQFEAPSEKPCDNFSSICLARARGTSCCVARIVTRYIYQSELV